MASRKAVKYSLWASTILIVAALAIAVLFTVEMQPTKAFGGAVWLKNGVNYISDAEISNRTHELNSPAEAAEVEKVKGSTPGCDSLDTGFCQKAPGEFSYKTLQTPPVPYTPATPDKKVIIGYCTACNDGTFSPSCAVGRGACSWHGGVAAYNVAQFRVTPGTPAIQAVPAVYSYDAKSYKDSPLYIAPEAPSLNKIVGY